MRRSASSVIPFLFLLILSLTAPLAAAQTDTSATASASAEAVDTTTAVTEEEKPSSGRVRISIDESGISVEGEASVKTNDQGWVEVYDSRGPYKEKGLDIVKFGESVFVDKDELVRGDLVVFGGNAIVEGRVTGNVVVIGGELRARSGAEIKGDAVVVGGSLDYDEDAIIHGERLTIMSVFPTFHIGDSVFHGPGWVDGAIFLAMAFVSVILAFLILLFLRDRVMRMHEHLAASYLKCFGVGVLSAFIGFFAVLIVAIPLIITLVGIPLAILLFISCAGVTMIGSIVFAYGIGTVISNKLNIGNSGPFMNVVVGLAVINLPFIIAYGFGLTHLVFFMPLAIALKTVGVIFVGFGKMAGLGALVLSRFGSRGLQSDVPPVSPAVATQPVPPA